MPLAIAAKLWPTPRKEGYDAQGKDHSDLVYEVKNRLYPTPTVPNGGRRNAEGTSITGRKPDGGKAQIDLREYAIRLESHHVPAASGSLNPRFVCWLMGFPQDWTRLK